MTTSQAMAAGLASKYGNGGSPKLVNPAPPRPHRPRENNIFGQPEPEASPFTTTYTQFSQRQKFRGTRDGERDGLRLAGDDHPTLMGLKRMSSNLYPGVPYGMEAGMPSAYQGGSHGPGNPGSRSQPQFAPLQEGGGYQNNGGGALSQQYTVLQQLMRERDRIYQQLSQGAMPTLQRQNLDLQMRDMENKIVGVEQRIFMLEQAQPTPNRY